MSEPQNDLGTIQAILDRLNNERLPRAMKLKAQVDRGDTLTEPDIAFLKQVFEDADNMRSLVAKHPDYQQLVADLTSLYSDIVNKGYENEKASGKPS